MNLLTEKAPDYITVRGVNIKIKTDFTLWVRFIIACENQDAEKLGKALFDIFGGVPQAEFKGEIISAVMAWLIGGKEGDKKGAASSSGAAAFDFETDGSVIYCELWEYFPGLMKRGISYHEGMELIKLLLQNENTAMWHRAFARCGDFSKMSKEQKSFWQQERAKYALSAKKRIQNQKSIDNTMSAAF